jgi:hypothetical protein
VGHRALVAYERPTAGYTVRYSQWGACGYRLLEAISGSTPLGGVRADDGPSRVRPGPLGVAADLGALAAEYVDPLAHEAVFVVDDDYCVRAFEPLAFWSDEPTTAYGGALVELRGGRDPSVDARELRAWCRGATAMSLPSGDGSADAAERERTHRRLCDALVAAFEGRRVERIPPRTREA